MLSEMVHLAIFWRNVEKSGQRVATFEVIEDAVLDGCGSGAVDGLYAYARGAESGYLVIHQCQQWRYDDGDAKVHHGRKLETQTLSEPGSCLEEDIVSLQSSRHHFSLDWSKEKNLAKHSRASRAHRPECIPGKDLSQREVNVDVRLFGCNTWHGGGHFSISRVPAGLEMLKLG